MSEINTAGSSFSAMASCVTATAVFASPLRTASYNFLRFAIYNSFLSDPHSYVATSCNITRVNTNLTHALKLRNASTIATMFSTGVPA